MRAAMIGGARLPSLAGGEAAAGGVELLAIGFVPPLLHTIDANGLRVLLLPDIGQEAVVVRGAREQLVQHPGQLHRHQELKERLPTRKHPL